MVDENALSFKQYELFLESAEKVSDRRASNNKWMLSVNSAITSLYGYLSANGDKAETTAVLVWQWAIPTAGILSCLAWIALLTSYRKLNTAKFKVLNDIEEGLPHRMYAKEYEYLKSDNRLDFSSIERVIPASFIALYCVILAHALGY